MQQIAQGVLVLVGIQAALGGAALGGRELLFGRREGRGQQLEEGLLRGGVGTLLDHLGWHFAGAEAVMHLDPFGEVAGIGQVEGQGREV